MMIPTSLPLLDFFVLLRSVSICSINFSSIVDSLDANSFFSGCDTSLGTLGCDTSLDLLGFMYGSLDVVSTSVILNDESVPFLILGTLVSFILLVICLCLGVKYCSTNASMYFLSCIEIILLFWNDSIICFNLSGLPFPVSNNLNASSIVESDMYLLLYWNVYKNWYYLTILHLFLGLVFLRRLQNPWLQVYLMLSLNSYSKYVQLISLSPV